MSVSPMRIAKLLGLVVLALLAVRPAQAADEAHTLSVRLDWLPSGYQGPLFLASEKGWYKKAGIDVTLVAGNGSATTVQLVGSGQFDAGEAALSNMAFGRGKGMPVISIAGFFRKGDLALLVPVDSPIKGPSDLKGKKIVYTAGSLEGPFLDYFIAKGGLTRSDVDLLNVDASAKLSTYVGGGVDGTFSTAVFIGLVAKTRPSRYILFSDYDLNLPGFGLVASQQSLAKKGAALRAFASVSAGAWTYTLAGHQEEAIDALMKANAQQRPDIDQMRGELKASVDFLYSKATEGRPIGFQSASDWAAAIALMEKAKTIEPGSKPADYFTNAYLDPAVIKSVGGG